METKQEKRQNFEVIKGHGIDDRSIEVNVMRNE